MFRLSWRKIDVRTVSAGVLSLCVVWLFCSAWILDIEYFDSFDVLMNTDYLLGRCGLYLDHKAPMLSVLMIPARLAGISLGLAPLNLRPYHLTMALLHSAYLIGVFWLLTIKHGLRWHVLAAFCATSLSFVFFSYGCFMNIDIFPGILFLSMIFLSDRFMGRRDKVSWCVLAFIGGFAALLKQTFGLFWVAALLANAVARPKAKHDINNDFYLRLALLFSSAACSFAVYYLFMCFALQGSNPRGPWLATPLTHLIEHSKPELEVSAGSLRWIYLLNFPFYGITTTLLLVPGLLVALKGNDVLQKKIAVSWLAAFAFLHLTIRLEVRYMLFLAPLSAFLLVPIIDKLRSKRIFLACTACLLSADMAHASWEALRLADAFYRNSQLKSFLAPLKHAQKGQACVINEYLCFIAPRESPFIGDFYHRKFHFSPYHVKHFVRGDLEYMWSQGKGQDLRNSLPHAPGTILIYGNFFPMNIKDSPDISRYVSLLAKSATLDVDASSVTDALDSSTDHFTDRRLARALDEHIYPFLCDTRSGRIHPILQTAPDAFTVELQGMIPAMPIHSPGTLPYLSAYKILRFVNVEPHGGTVLAEISGIDSR